MMYGIRVVLGDFWVIHGDGCMLVWGVGVDGIEQRVEGDHGQISVQLYVREVP
jgi:hypothetical protein